MRESEALRRTFPPPERVHLRESWGRVIDAACALLDALEDHTPECRNRDEALMRVKKAFMVAQGAFVVREHS